MIPHSGRPPGRQRPFVLLVLVVLVALVAETCGSPAVPSLGPSQPPASLGAASEGPSPSIAPSALPSELPSEGPTEAPSPTVSPSASISPSPTAQASCVQQMLREMTVAQRIGQLFSLGLSHNKLGAAELGTIKNQHVGSFWFTATTTVGVAGIRTVTNAVQAQATQAATDGIRMFIAANQEGGQIQPLRGTGFSTIPSAVVQGGRPISTLTAQARVWGSQLKAAGVNMDFAPVADVVPPGGDSTNQPIGVLMREYGHDPTTAGTHAAAFVAGMAAAGIDTTAKHFPGLGRVVNNTDDSANVVDTVTTANDPYLNSFRDTINAGVPFVMIALATYTKIDPNHIAAFSPTVMSLLRNQLGFRGVIVSDSLTAAAVTSIPAGQRAIDFLLAGGDVVVVNSASVLVTMVAAVQARAATDSSFLHLVNEATLLVLQAKLNAGLLPPGC